MDEKITGWSFIQTIQLELHIYLIECMIVYLNTVFWIRNTES